MMKNWQNEHVLIIGAARQGLALSRYLCTQGSQVTINDSRTEEQLKKNLESIRELPVHFVLGSHPLETLDGITQVCISGGVSPEMPLVREALSRGLPVSNDAQVFMDVVPCKTIGITGSAGKTTTTTLVGRICRAGANSDQKIWVGGNIGTPMITYIDQISPSDLVILELSSFQLELMTTSPNISAVLNITPNHLDRHGTMEAYKTAKRRILDFQSVKDEAILCRDDAGSIDLTAFVKGHLSTFGWNIPMDRIPGTYLQDDKLWYSNGKEEIFLLSRDDIKLRGDHNVLNVLAACAITAAAGISPDSMREGIEDFSGVDHRLEYVDTVNGAAWYNDSIATAPERTMAAIRSFTEPMVLLIGGRDKNLPWEDLANLINQRVDHVIVFGEAAPKILAALERVEKKKFSIDRAAGLSEAVKLANERAEPDDVVLLSPGGTSYDEFEDFEERGECFRTLVKNLH